MRCVQQFLRTTGGAAAVEFALVSSLLITTIIFIMVVALTLYFDQALDFATAKAARQIMTGQVQQNNISQSAFRRQGLCSYLPASMNCNNVIISVVTVTEGTQPNGYYSLVNAGATALNLPPLNVDSSSYSVGTAGSYEYLLVVYPVTFLPSICAKVLGGGATYNGVPAFLLVSTAAFKNELFN